jgi:uncharacterized protein (UPF0335 family)
MSKIEDVLYEAHDLGLREKVLEEVLKSKSKEKNKHKELSDLYETAFKKIKEN